MIIVPGDRKGVVNGGVFDKDNDSIITIIIRPADWQANTEYLLDQVVMDPVPNGFYYKVTSPGISDGVVPTFGTTVDSKTISGSVEFTAVAYNLFLNTGETITSVVWVADNSVTLSNETISGGVANALVDTIPDATESFTVTATFSKNSNGVPVKEDISIFYVIVVK